MHPIRTRLLIIINLLLMCQACGAQETLAPDPVPSSLATPAGAQIRITFSGMVYEAYRWSDKGEPPIAGALVKVTDATGSRSTRSDAYGRYALTVPYGDSTITASKGGYQTRTWPVTASDLPSMNVTWNFSLAAR